MRHEASLNSGQERIAAALLTVPLFSPLLLSLLCCCRRTYLLQKDALCVIIKMQISPISCHNSLGPTWTHSAQALQTKGAVSLRTGKGRHSRMSSVTSSGSDLSPSNISGTS